MLKKQKQLLQIKKLQSKQKKLKKKLQHQKRKSPYLNGQNVQVTCSSQITRMSSSYNNGQWRKIIILELTILPLGET